MNLILMSYILTFEQKAIMKARQLYPEFEKDELIDYVMLEVAQRTPLTDMQLEEIREYVTELVNNYF